jgi:hypothetical protein
MSANKPTPIEREIYLAVGRCLDYLESSIEFDLEHDKDLYPALVDYMQSILEDCNAIDRWMGVQGILFDDGAVCGGEVIAD